MTAVAKAVTVGWKSGWGQGQSGPRAARGGQKGWSGRNWIWGGATPPSLKRVPGVCLPPPPPLIGFGGNGRRKKGVANGGGFER